LIFITPRIIKNQFDARDRTIDHADGLDDLMKSNQIEPWRDDVLHSEKIDAVSEVEMYEGEKPTTIRPATRKKLRQNDESQGDMQHSAPSDSEETIELRVTPKLPEMSQTLETSKGTPMAMAKLQAPKRKAGRFVILELGDLNEAAQLPFGAGAAAEDGSIIFGLEVPEGSLKSAEEFFAEGGTYSYKSGDDSAALKALGTFASMNEAQEQYPGLSSDGWHTLSPFEIMNLGKGPWSKQQ
jgi:hypothetical protein